MTQQKDFSVAIIGGGIGGLATAIGLLRAGIKVDVYESAHKFEEIGAGVSFGLNAQRALQGLGLFEEFKKKATIVPHGDWFQWRTGEGNEQRLICTTTCENGNSSVHRAEFLDALVSHIPSSVAHFGKRLNRLEQGSPTEPVRLFFADGSEATADVVIGADGIHSTVRGALGQEQAGKSAQSGKSGLVWSGTWAYRGLIPREKFEAAVGKNGKLYALTPQMFLGLDKHILIFPIQDNETINVVAFATDRSQWPERAKMNPGEPWVQPCSQEEMLRDFEGWGDELIALLKCIDKPSKWALHQIVPSLRSYVSGKAVLIGDAAHGGVPHHGALAGQAIEDALFLSRLLAHPGVTRDNLASVLPAMDAIRLPRANKVLETSLEAGEVYEYRGPAGDDLDALGKHLPNRMDWIWYHDHDEDIKKAELWLKENGATKA